MPIGKARELPNNIEAERSVLACCMLDGEFAAKYAPTLSSRDFYRPAHQSLIVAIRALVSKGRACDQITVFDYLESRGSKVGRSEVVAICDNTYAFVEAQSHLEIVRKCSLQRSIIRCCKEIEAMAYDPQEDAEAVRQRAVTAIMSLLSEPASASADDPEQP